MTVNDTVKSAVVVFAHGAWHRPLHYGRLFDQLQGKGYPVYAPAMPTAGWTDSVGSMSWTDDVAAIRRAMAPALEAGHEVVVVGHSWGGYAGTEAVVGETVAERRARGLPGGVKGIVYLTALTPTAGKNHFEIAHMKDESDHPDWWEPKGDVVLLIRDKAMDALFWDIDPVTAEMGMESTVKQTLQAFRDPFQHSGTDIDVPKSYVVCKGDRAISYEVQLAFAKGAGAVVTEIDCGHSPFLMNKECIQVRDVIIQMLEK